MYDFIVVGSGLAAKISMAFLAQSSYRLAHLTLDSANFQKEVLNNIGSKHYVVLNHKTLRRFKNLGINIEAEKLNNLTEYGYYRQREKIFSLDSASLSIQQLGQQVEISVLVSALEQFLNSKQKVTRYHAQLNNLIFSRTEGVEIHLDDHKILKGRYLILATGDLSSFKKFLPNIPLRKEFILGQGALKGFLSLQKPNLQKTRAYQICLGDLLMGFIPRSSLEATVVLTGKKDLLTDYQELGEDFLKKKILDSLPFHREDCQVTFDSKVLSLSTSSLEESVFDKYCFIGMSAESLHPAGAMGLNFIVEKTAYFSYFLHERGDKISSWKNEYQTHMKKKYESICLALQFLTNARARSFLSFSALQRLPAFILEFFIA
jgi:2-polyprenyl-6-methoxyphenol hydroxylase-like FAD-dependent oxidoreductase